MDELQTLSALVLALAARDGTEDLFTGAGYDPAPPTPVERESLARDLAGFEGNGLVAVLEALADLRHLGILDVFIVDAAEPRSVRCIAVRCGNAAWPR